MTNIFMLGALTMVLLIFMLFYMDDMLIVAIHLYDMNELKILLEKEFDMNELSGSKKIIGMEIHMDKSTKNL